MADLTIQIELTETWKNVSAEAGLDPGSRYASDIFGLQPLAAVWSALTDDANEPTALILGHPWRPTARGRDVPTRSVQVEAGETLWVRVDRGTATLILSKSS